MEGSVPKALRHERARAAIALAGKHEEEFLRSQVGTTAEVLFESKGGHTPNNCETEMLPGREGQVLRVRITGVRDGRLTVSGPEEENG